MVRAVAIATLTPGLQFALSGARVEEMEVVPGQTGSLVIAHMNPGLSPRHLGLFVYDNGVRRPQSTPGHTRSNSITFGETASVVYGYNNETSEFGFRTMAVAAGGITEIDVTPGLVNAPYSRIRYASGRVYVTSGAIIDGERWIRNTFQLLGTIGFTRDDTEHPAQGRMRLVRWGTDGLAFRDGERVHIFRTTLAAP